MGAIFTQEFDGLSVTAATNFFQLRGGADRRYLIHEIRVFQTSETALAMNAIQIDRGTGGTGGTGLTERKYDIVTQVPVATAFSNASAFTAEVGTLDLTINVGWNVLQELVWLPTPKLIIPLAASDHLGLSLLNADSLTIGGQITWEELGV